MQCCGLVQLDWPRHRPHPSGDKQGQCSVEKGLETCRQDGPFITKLFMQAKGRSGGRTAQVDAASWFSRFGKGSGLRHGNLTHCKHEWNAITSTIMSLGLWETLRKTGQWDRPSEQKYLGVVPFVGRKRKAHRIATECYQSHSGYYAPLESSMGIWGLRPWLSSLPAALSNGHLWPACLLPRLLTPGADRGGETLDTESEEVCSIIGNLNFLGRVSAPGLQLGRPLGLLLSLTSTREKVKAEDGQLSPTPRGEREGGGG